MSRDRRTKLESWSETVVNFLLIIETIERIAVSKTIQNITYPAYVSHIHTQSVTYILVFEAMDPDWRDIDRI